ncbi:alpha/beta fold hydrolase [Microvirga alba]|uniref:Alpha/beta fold hydrolase n=1 Tax=Microvirga alba TaxID=2791025 RepID=A0A931BRQ7_9HYPH|nr:alpha/beta fold hydrolase [Microvirga alba]MBF9234015.1 alpha/beta fold hydrolase [Microvirga alba]
MAAPLDLAEGVRGFFQAGSVRPSYVDFGGSDEAPILVALHGHFGCARNFAPLAEAMRPHSWRVLALDQRGHGWSDHPETCGRVDYGRDAEAFILHIAKGRPVVLLGHSLGGVNAYQLAARRADLVKALIIEDVGARIDPLPAFALDCRNAFRRCPKCSRLWNREASAVTATSSTVFMKPKAAGNSGSRLPGSPVP